MLYCPKRTKVKILFTVILAVVSAVAVADDVCINDDGFIVPCPPNTGAPAPVQGYWSLPVFVKGKPADVYIIGGAAVEGPNYFVIQVENGPVVLASCNTGSDGGTTPIRHCVLTIPVSGPYMLHAYGLSAYNFRAPQPVGITVLNQ